MSDLIKVGPMMSSREIADLVESRNDNVKQSIERLAERANAGETTDAVDACEALDLPAPSGSTWLPTQTSCRSGLN
ncbi:hypothetical protein ACU4GI_20210 [Cupriavidus basilensis]